MSYMLVGLAVVGAIGVGIATQISLFKPMPALVVPLAPGMAAEKQMNKAMMDRAAMFANAAANAGTFSGIAQWPAVAASAAVPGAITATSFPSNWTAQWVGSTLNLCMPGLSNAAVTTLSTQLSGVAVKNNGC